MSRAQIEQIWKRREQSAGCISGTLHSDGGELEGNGGPFQTIDDFGAALNEEGVFTG